LNQILFILIHACDASPVRILAVLSHKYLDGFKKPINFKTKALNATESRYSQIDKEIYALAFGVKKFHHYLCGRKFTSITNHKPLTVIFEPKAGILVLAVSRLQK
jgi:RNase H-like domain found in reverse transcriptase